MDIGDFCRVYLHGEPIAQAPPKEQETIDQNYSMEYPQAYDIPRPNTPTVQFGANLVPFDRQGYQNEKAGYGQSPRNSSSYHPYRDPKGKENTMPNVLPPSETNMKQPHNKAPKPTRNRTTFTAIQLLVLEKKFQEKQYLNRFDRASLSVDLCMTEKQIKTWFQNRRTKNKEMQSEVPKV
nr:unnamed protein product [Callosobruchus chinensis]